MARRCGLRGLPSRACVEREHAFQSSALPTELPRRDPNRGVRGQGASPARWHSTAAQYARASEDAIGRKVRSEAVARTFLLFDRRLRAVTRPGERSDHADFGRAFGFFETFFDRVLAQFFDHDDVAILAVRAACRFAAFSGDDPGRAGTEDDADAAAMGFDARGARRAR